MGAWSIGRVTIDDGGAPDPGVSWDGDQLSFRGTIIADTQAAMVAKRDQIIGLANNADEPVIPVTWSDDDTVDGFYRVLGSSATASSGAAYSAFWLDFDISLEKVPGWQAPLFEVLSRGAGGTPIVGIPETAHNTWATVSTTNPSSWARGCEGGTARVLAGSGASAGQFNTDTVLFRVTAANYYEAACKIKIGGDELVGRQVVSGHDDWSIDNGLVRVTYRASGGRWNIEHHDGTQWDTAKGWRLWHDGSGGGATAWPAEFSLTVLRNSPETCAIRLHCNSTTAGLQTYYDITVKRGDRFARVYAHGFAAKHGVLLETSEAGTDVSTYGITATATDGPGNRYYVQGTTGAITTNTTIGGLFLTVAAAGFSCGIASQVNFATITSFDDTTGLNGQYAPTDVTQRSTAR